MYKKKEEVQKLIANLKYYQMWRRGVDNRLAMPKPKDVSKWLYQAIELIEEYYLKED